MSKKAKYRRIIVKLVEHVIGVAIILLGIYTVCGIAAMACGALGVL